jgi:hypothetical protein
MTLITLLRTPKIFDMAIFDWSMTLIALYFISNYIQEKYNIKNRNLLDFKILIILIIMAIYFHNLYNVKSKFSYYLGINENPRI